MPWSDLFRNNPRHFPKLADRLQRKLAAITPSEDIYYPCAVTLRDGRELDCVYLAPAERWFMQWGVWPDEDRGKVDLPIEEVVDLRESPSRLPPNIASEIYAAGESGMGYCLFTLTFSDGSDCAFVTGNAVDFPDLPAGKRVADIVGVTPHAGRDRPDRRDSLPYSWCLFGEK